MTGSFGRNVNVRCNKHLLSFGIVKSLSSVREIQTTLACCLHHVGSPASSWDFVVAGYFTPNTFPPFSKDSCLLRPCKHPLSKSCWIFSEPYILFCQDACQCLMPAVRVQQNKYLILCTLSRVVANTCI